MKELTCAKCGDKFVLGFLDNIEQVMCDTCIENDEDNEGEN